jgi:hypothetical protein
MSINNVLFEFKQPIIVSKTPSITYAFPLLETQSINNTYSEKVDYSIIVNDNKEFISSLIGLFCEKCSKYFSRPLDANRLLSRLVHSDYAVNIENEGGIDANSEPVIYEWKYTPYRIIISGTEFKIEWCVEQIEIKCIIDIHADDVNEVYENNMSVNAADISLNALTTEENINELKTKNMAADNFDEVPDVQLKETDVPVSEDSTPIAIKIYGRSEDYKRLKKAQLRVEMAKFKAELAYTKYVQRWGYLSEDSGSDSE